MSFSAIIIADSKSEIGNHRLTTVKAIFPRYLLAEFNTHKMISKNSASSRAIPAKKLIESVRKQAFMPEKWMLDHPGMQGTNYITDERVIDFKQGVWERAKNEAISRAEELNGPVIYHPTQNIRVFKEIPDSKVTKQISNRLLEPFMYHTALMSATEWENFFALRAEGAAEVNFQKSAFQILDAMNTSEPKQLKAGEWHLPYGDDLSPVKITDWYRDINKVPDNDPAYVIAGAYEEIVLKIATARCAGVSYVVVGEDGKEESYEKLIHRHDERLVKPGHWSPMEHPAKAMTDFEYHHFGKSFIIRKNQFDEYNAVNDSASYWFTINMDDVIIREYGWCGNYRGFIQYRKMFSNENRRDSRLIKK